MRQVFKPLLIMPSKPHKKKTRGRKAKFLVLFIADLVKYKLRKKSLCKLNKNKMLKIEIKGQSYEAEAIHEGLSFFAIGFVNSIIFNLMCFKGMNRNVGFM